MGTSTNTWQGQILLADDDRILLQLGSTALSRAGFHVDIATDGQHAFDLLSLTAYDLVITDLRMPRMDGLELIRRIRSDAATKDLPVIVITGLEIADSLDTAYSAGATSFATKPINWRPFAYHARYVLRSSRQQEELRIALAKALATKNKLIEITSALMTPAQIAETQRLAREWKPKK
jgi:PleD family two-component response regulator